jgi:hypothetical protein
LALALAVVGLIACVLATPIATRGEAREALVVRDVLRPELDVVRQDGVDDPAGGVLDGAPDARAA